MCDDYKVPGDLLWLWKARRIAVAVSAIDQCDKAIASIDFRNIESYEVIRGMVYGPGCRTAVNHLIPDAPCADGDISKALDAHILSMRQRIAEQASFIKNNLRD